MKIQFMLINIKVEDIKVEEDERRNFHGKRKKEKKKSEGS